MYVVVVFRVLLDWLYGAQGGMGRIRDVLPITCSLGFSQGCGLLSARATLHLHVDYNILLCGQRFVEDGRSSHLDSVA